MTTKLGSSDKRPGTAAVQPSPVLRFYASEMMMSLFVLTAALYGIFSVNKWSFSIFLTLQGVAPLSPHLLIPPPAGDAWSKSNCLIRKRSSGGLSDPQLRAAQPCVPALI